MIPDWKLERFLTGDLPEEEMNKLRELEANDAVFANRVKMLREDNKAILSKLPLPPGLLRKMMQKMRCALRS